MAFMEIWKIYLTACNYSDNQSYIDITVYE